MGSNGQSAWLGALEGNRYGNYTISHYLGGGAFGAVYQARNEDTGADVALKLLLPNSQPEGSAEFLLEGELLERLKKSTGVVDLNSAGELTITVSMGGLDLPLGFKFLELELASGCLEELLVDPVRRSNVAWQERLALWRGVILGTHQMHGKNLVHRDLKSSNCLLLVGRKDKSFCKVGDLGRSRDLNRPARYMPQDYLAGRGDLRFAPPEFLWWQGDETPEAHRAADLYGLGSVLFEVAAGVGVTQYALGIGPELVRQNLSAARGGQVIDLAVLGPRYESALNLFESELPAAIRQQGRALLQQLCNPVPGLRGPKRNGRRVGSTDNLDWLLRQVDILSRRLSSATKQQKSSRPRRIAS